MPVTHPSIAPLLDQFIPAATVGGRHQTVVRAPAATVFETARRFDLRKVPSVRAIFWLRARILGARSGARDWSRGFVDEMVSLGWGVLEEMPGRWLVAGAVCQPWRADVVFTPVPADRFAAFAEPGFVKIVWTLEVEPLGQEKARFSTETRAAGTDAQAQATFRHYWRRFGIGIIAIRLLLLPAIRREAERRWKQLARGE